LRHIQVNSETLLLANCGLGDHLIANAAVRHLASIHAPLVVIHRACYERDVAWLYRDLIESGEIRLHCLKDDRYPYSEAQALAREGHWDQVIDIGGFSGTNRRWGQDQSFDRDIYRLAGVDFEQKWTGFQVDRHPREIVPPDCPYVLIHQDVRREMRIKLDRIEFDGMRYHVQGFNAETIFQLRAVIERANELHLIDSAPMCFADLIHPQGRKVWHRYARTAEFAPEFRGWEVCV